MSPLPADKPRIGIPWRTLAEEQKGERQKLEYYFESVRRAGGEPVPVSLRTDTSAVRLQIEEIEGFVLPGSPADVEPALYRTERHAKTKMVDAARDSTDGAILEEAFATGKPVLAICYGCQRLNVSLGGTLYQDIASELSTDIEHSRTGLPKEAPDPGHAARIEPGGELAQLAATLGLENHGAGFNVYVNTSHHQAVRDVGHGLRVAAVAPDGVIEAVEHEPHKHWVVGVQWHPERMEGDALAAALFRAMVQATRAIAARR